MKVHSFPVFREAPYGRMVHYRNSYIWKNVNNLAIAIIVQEHSFPVFRKLHTGYATDWEYSSFHQYVANGILDKTWGSECRDDPHHYGE